MGWRHNLQLLQRLQYRILRIINKNHFALDYLPLRLEQLYSLETLTYHYQELKHTFLQSESITRNKSIIVPLRHKSISAKNSCIKAIVLFNSLPNELKKRSTSTKSIKRKLKIWIFSNI